MSGNVADGAADSTRMDTALALAAEFRAVLRYAIDAMPQRVTPFSPDAILSYVLQGMTASVHGSFEGAILLCSKGWGLEADVLLRQMLEAVVNLRAIKRSPSALYTYVAEIEREADSGAGKESASDRNAPPSPTHILGPPPANDSVAWYQTGKRKGERRLWKTLSMAERIRLADLEADTWYGFYQRLCKGVHAVPISLPYYLIRTPPSATMPFAIWFGPNWQAAFRAVGTACALLLVHIGTISSAFSIQLHREISELGERLQMLR